MSKTYHVFRLGDSLSDRCQFRHRGAWSELNLILSAFGSKVCQSPFSLFTLFDHADVRQIEYLYVSRIHINEVSDFTQT